MAKIKYFTKGANNTLSIHLRFYHGRKFDFKRSTSLLVEKSYWDNAKGKVKNIASFKDKLNLQNDLNGLRNHILNNFNTDYSNGKLIDSEWIKIKITNYFSQDQDVNFNYLIDYASHFKKGLENRILNSGKTGYNTSTINRYQVVINKLVKFEKLRGKKLLLTDVNLKFHKNFIDFLRTNERLGVNTVGRHLKSVKTIVNYASEYGLKINDDINKREFRIPKEKTDFITLDENEIEKIFKHNFEHKPFLNNAKKWLIIGLWTGARVSDLLNFKNENITNGFIEFVAQKTSQKIIIPLHPQILEMLHQSNGQFPQKISAQKFNDYIKLICRDVGLNEQTEGSKLIEIENKIWRKVKGEYPKWELVTSHICRRSFATNHYGKLPTPVIMSITGHATETMFLNYIGKTAKDNAEILNNFWQLQDKKKNNITEFKILKAIAN